MNITNEQWVILEPLLPRGQRSPQPRRGRPWHDARAVLNGILWVHRTGAVWSALPDRYPPYQTCHRRFQQWVRAGVWGRMLRALADDLAERGGLDLRAAGIGRRATQTRQRTAPRIAPITPEGPRSWQWRTALVLIAPTVSRVRRRAAPRGKR